MDLNLIKTSVNLNNNYSLTSAAQVPEELATAKPIPVNKAEAGKNHSQSEEEAKDQLSREDVNQLTEHLNKFMSMINANLQFELHEGTKRMMVRFVDQKDNRVIKEFPPHELLDTLASIRDYVGLLLDKKI